eukprot:2156854-Rhodomonas_salina.3
MVLLLLFVLLVLLSAVAAVAAVVRVVVLWHGASVTSSDDVKLEQQTRSRLVRALATRYALPTLAEHQPFHTLTMLCPELIQTLWMAVRGNSSGSFSEADPSESRQSSDGDAARASSGGGGGGGARRRGRGRIEGAGRKRA